MVFFLDSAHFVRGAFLGLVWCFCRVFLKAPSGRERFNVLGALNPITHEVIMEHNDAYITATTVCALLAKLRARYPDKPISIVLDNARYQHCRLVMARALELGIDLVFLPSYSPNLNLIERLWKFVKKECLYSKYYASFGAFKTAIYDCIAEGHLLHKEKLESLLTLNFQTFENTQVLTV